MDEWDKYHKNAMWRDYRENGGVNPPTFYPEDHGAYTKAEFLEAYPDEEWEETNFEGETNVLLYRNHSAGDFYYTLEEARKLTKSDFGAEEE
jgi:hypothetical protein